MCKFHSKLVCFSDPLKMTDNRTGTSLQQYLSIFCKLWVHNIWYYIPLTRTDQNRPEQTRTHQNTPEHTRTHQNTPEHTRTDQNRKNRQEQNRTGQNRPEQNRTEQNRTDQIRTEQNRTEQIKPNHAVIHGFSMGDHGLLPPPPSDPSLFKRVC
jgi:hypothetical protein